MTGAERRRWVLDTSAILALRGNEPGAARVETILRAARSEETAVLASFMTRMELLYRISRDEDRSAAEDALRLLDAAGVRWVSCGEDILRAAAALKERGALSVADAWIAATAQVSNAVLVHKDPEFAVAREVVQERLR